METKEYVKVDEYNEPVEVLDINKDDYEVKTDVKVMSIIIDTQDILGYEKYDIYNNFYYQKLISSDGVLIDNSLILIHPENCSIEEELESIKFSLLQKDPEIETDDLISKLDYYFNLNLEEYEDEFEFINHISCNINKEAMSLTI